MVWARGLKAGRKDFNAAIAIFDDPGSRRDLGWTLVSRGEDEDLLRARDLLQASGAT